MDETILIGKNAINEALRSGGQVNRLYLAKESRARWADAALEQARAAKVRFDFVPQAKLNELSGTQQHQGVVAIVSPVAYTPLKQCLADCSERATLLALDRIQHVKNLGMLIRTALGADASGVLIPNRGGALLDADVVRASAGAVFHVPIVKCGNLAQALRACKQAGFWLYGLDAKGECDLFETSWPQRTVLVLGNETQGLRPQIKKACDVLVRIPLPGDLDSLNVAVAGGIALFNIAGHASSCER